MSEKIKSIIANQLNIDESSIKEDSTFKDDLGADSLDLFHLFMAFEYDYGLSTPSEDLEKNTTVGAVVAYLQDKGVEV